MQDLLTKTAIEALRPFAKLADLVEVPASDDIADMGAIPDDEPLAPEYTLDLTFGDCRRAREALALLSSDGT